MGNYNPIHRRRIFKREYYTRWYQVITIDWLQFIDSVILRVKVKLDILEGTNEFFMLQAILLGT